MNREKRMLRASISEFTTREDGENPIIEGYFAVYNSNYQIADDMSESIAPGAFSECLNEDIRALINHDTSMVLGRSKAYTLYLEDRPFGLWCVIKINPKDVDAMNLYERVKRGDVDQCSIGFDILSEETEFRDDGSVHWTITKAFLYEVSVCTFPAYEETTVSARQKDFDSIKKRNHEKWQGEMRRKLRGDAQ